MLLSGAHWEYVIHLQVASRFLAVGSVSTSEPNAEDCVDENNERYWEYVYRIGRDEWELVREVEGPLPSKLSFASAVTLTD